MSSTEFERIDSGKSPQLALPAPKQTCATGRRLLAHWPAHVDDDFDPIARLEWLDDLIFAAIDGDASALDGAADAWRKTRDELGDTAVEETRQQYLRRAQSVWQSLRNEPNHPPHKVFAAIEIISLLANRAR